MENVSTIANELAATINTESERILREVLPRVLAQFEFHPPMNWSSHAYRLIDRPAIGVTIVDYFFLHALVCRLTIHFDDTEVKISYKHI